MGGKKERVSLGASGERPSFWRFFSTMASAVTLSAPADDPADLSIWPNRVSRANSDAWLARHHDLIRRMQPRLLVINFSNQARRDHLDRMLDAIIAAWPRAVAITGIKISERPAFCNTGLFKFVDLRDAGGGMGNSTKLPSRQGGAPASTSTTTVSSARSRPLLRRSQSEKAERVSCVSLNSSMGATCTRSGFLWSMTSISAPTRSWRRSPATMNPSAGSSGNGYRLETAGMRNRSGPAGVYGCFHQRL